MQCYLCGKNQLKIIRTKVRTDIPREVLECQNCGLTYLIKPKDIDLKQFYIDEYRKKYTPIVGESMECREMFNLLLPFQKARIDQIKHILNSKTRVLDVGCSVGHFLFALKDKVQECIGIEYNTREAEFVKKELGIKTYTSSIEETDLPLEYFDLITIYQVLEHVDDPIKFLRSYKRYLKSNGYISIEVPNIQDILISGYQIEPFIDFWFRESHLFYYSPKTLTLTLEKAGFKGKVKGFQQYNFLNHLNWKFTGKPQKSIDIGYSDPILINNISHPNKNFDEFNLWFKKINQQYMNLLEKNMLSESILFIGQKI